MCVCPSTRCSIHPLEADSVLPGGLLDSTERRGDHRQHFYEAQWEKHGEYCLVQCWNSVDSNTNGDDVLLSDMFQVLFSGNTAFNTKPSSVCIAVYDQSSHLYMITQNKPFPVWPACFSSQYLMVVKQAAALLWRIDKQTNYATIVDLWP